MRLLAIALGCLVVAATPVEDAIARDRTAADGARLAAARCSRCHATGVTDESPQSVAPPFRSLHKEYPIAMLVEAQKTGQISGHDEMPGFEFSPEEVEALLLHIDSLAPEKPAYVKR